MSATRVRHPVFARIFDRLSERQEQLGQAEHRRDLGEPALRGPRSGGSFPSGGLAREYGFTDTDGSQPDCWRYLVEVQDAGVPPDPTGYR